MFSGPEDKNCTSYVISDGVTEIGVEAFAECSSLKTIKVPKGMDVSRWKLNQGVRIIYY